MSLRSACSGGGHAVGSEGRDDRRAHDHSQCMLAQAHAITGWFPHPGSLHERAEWLSEIQHGSQLHLLRSAEVGGAILKQVT
jgi:hypothetical protein